MSQPDDLELIRHQLAPAFHAVAAGAERGPECLDDITLAGLADGTLELRMHADALAHLATCAHCRAAVASFVRLLSDPAVRSSAPGTTEHPWRRRASFAVPLAAAAILLAVFALPRRGDDAPPPHRGTPATATTPMLVAPVGLVADGSLLRWTTVLGADRYRITVFDAESRLVYSEVTTDTLAVLPDSTILLPGRPYMWMVEARTGWDRWSASAPVSFSIAADGAR